MKRDSKGRFKRNPATGRESAEILRLRRKHAKAMRKIIEEGRRKRKEAAKR